MLDQDAMTHTLDQVTEKVMTGRVAVLASSSPTELGLKGIRSYRRRIRRRVIS
ncbi:hypothetical protein LJK88_24390 [Paenibacillus sp. P26]|nr:hypothetical protein LJK88_24390 [Paenibacillus sp. P26]